MKLTKKLLFTPILVILLCFTIIPSITIAAAPVANFTGNPTIGTAPLTVTFTDTSIGNPTGWAWYFGDETYTAPWTQMTPSAGWTARCGHSSVVMLDGSIVIMGGRGDYGYNNEVWRSTDNGSTWTQVNASAGWSTRAGQSSVVMPDGSIMLMGGVGADGLHNDVWRSTNNGATWTPVNASAGWSARHLHSSVVMPDSSIVLMGGEDYLNPLNDTWLSTDNGATWTQVNASSGWSTRAGQSSVVMPDGSIVLIGGAADNDVWRSMDNGATWTQVNASAGWTRRYGHSSVVMPDNSIVLMGGGFLFDYLENDVWRSMDNGTTWTQVDASAGWTTRYGQSSVVMPDGSIVLMGGISGIYKNDVWRLNPIGSSAQNTSHTFTRPGVYNVALQVYNAYGYNNKQKSGYINVTVPGAPVTSFTVIPLSGSGTAPLTVQFNDSSANFPVAWNWSFRNVTPGNNTQIWFSNIHNPKRTFGVGNYSIVLNASNSAGYNLSKQVTFINVTTNVKSKMGIFRPSIGMWSLDSNGNNVWDVTDTSLSWGLPNDVPVIGDWNGDYKDDIGIFRPSNGVWSLDSNGNNVWDLSDTSLRWGLPGDIPVIGDWNGDGKDEIGIFRPSTGMWSLDSNGNFTWEVSDTSLSWGLPNDIPVIGDWNGDYRDDIGIFRSTSGIWSLDLNGNNAWDVTDTSLSWGLPGDIPAIGDWNGDKKDDIGIFRPSSAMWSLDSNGNFAWETYNQFGGFDDTSLSWGLLNDQPVIGDWNSDGKDGIGIFRPSSGIWSIDSNENFIWEPTDKSLSWGLPNDKPIVGKH